MGRTHSATRRNLLRLFLFLLPLAARPATKVAQDDARYPISNTISSIDKGEGKVEETSIRAESVEIFSLIQTHHQRLHSIVALVALVSDASTGSFILFFSLKLSELLIDAIHAR
jgi:hypothetical protein